MDALSIEAELIEGDKGVFDVVADGQVVFSKYDAGRFPNPGELVRSLEGLQPES